jgi:hypothetical protein
VSDDADQSVQPSDRGAKSGTTGDAADRAKAAELLAKIKAELEAAGFKVQPKPDAAFAPAYVELPDPLRQEVCPDCGLTFMVRLDWFLARAEKREHVYCPAGHIVELKGVPADVQVMTARELLARIRTVELDNQRLRHTLDRVPRLASKPPDEREMARRFKWMVNHANRTAYGQHACYCCGEQKVGQQSMLRHLKKHHADEVAALPVEHFDQP